MKTLRSHVCGNWHEAKDEFATLHDPCTGEPIAQASTSGIDFAAVVDHARTVGGPALRAMTFAERGAVLKAMSKALHVCRDELIELSMATAGATRKDAKFDLDGATGTLAYYAGLGKELGERHFLEDGEGTQLGRTARFWGQHYYTSRAGVAIHINAFNFPAWGFAEKAACSILAGVPVISKPATSTAMVTERCAEILVDAAAMPDGVFQFVCGRTGNLLDLLGPQDVLAFTGSASTGLKLRRQENLLANSVAVNIEADSLNAAVLAPDVDSDSETWELFLQDVHRELTQKTGQKCTAVRRIFVPADRADEVIESLSGTLGDVVIGDPRGGNAKMGPLATSSQLEDAIAGVAKLSEKADIVFGTGQRIDGVDAEAGKGYYFAPTLLRAKDSWNAGAVHDHEVFGPVATILPYDGSAKEAAALVGLGGGMLVTSVYSNDNDWLRDYALHGGSTSGRLYIGSEKMAPQAPGSGIAMPQSMHGGPGRAGGGEELGALRGLRLYMQRVALQGDRKVLEQIGAPAVAGAGQG